MDMNMGNHKYNNTDSFSTQNWLAFYLSNFEEHQGAGAGTGTTVFDKGPRLEDFLCGSSTVSGAGTAPVAVTVSNNEIYDSELKAIAASFLRGFSSQNKPQQCWIINLIHYGSLNPNPN
ncbi:hypothetical protein F3Y22_tig00110418pilonHSYRG00017 [Hibiscus syriacus]|uniref:Uncharacterized protein n=1 Tax=Hibiscus syriacus TaxID=106335 RepID=A0A6A3AM37_HIBSY|nr:hypothetical protein F3Y22_tig00110418pilonHSYRG00017 [Hibiscus syriacus]